MAVAVLVLFRSSLAVIGSCPHAQVVVVPEAGHYPQSQQPDITTGAVLRFLESVQGRG
jgi:pimeloyl-ACP methyl ester carboxylesterase